MTVRQGRPLRWQLALLCIGLLVPTAAFVGALLWSFAASERSRGEEEAQGLSHALAVTLDREVFGVLTTLQTLATSPSLLSGDLPAFYAQMNEVRGFQHINVSLRDTEGHVLMTTRAPLGTRVASPPELIRADRQVLATGRETVTNTFTSATAGTPVFQVIAAPVVVDGTAKFLLAASVDPVYLADAFRRENLPKGWTGVLLDGTGIVVARTDQQDRFQGRQVSDGFLAHVHGDGGTFYGRNATGTDSLIGYGRSPLTGWIASVNTPVAVVLGPFRHSLLLLVILGVCLASAAFGFALWIGRRVDGALLQLTGAAVAIGDGRPVEGVATPISEINQVGAALHEAARQLGARAAERSQAEATLRDSEAHLAGVFAQTGAGLAEGRLDGTFLAVNDRYCDLVGRTREQLMGMRLQDIPHPDDHEVNGALMRRTLDAGEAVTAEKRFVRGDGSLVWVANTMSLIRTDRGGATLLSVAIDISEQKRVEQDLEAARDAAEQANTAKSEFLANMSHELRTPLSAIIGFSELMAEEIAEGCEPADLAPDMAKVEGNARHLLGLINNVLDLSKVESGKMDVFAEDFAVEAMLRDVVSTVGTLVDKKGNVLQLEFAAELGTAHTDLVKVRQMLLNLLSNAAKFTEDGTITLGAARETGPDGEGWLRLSVRDSGIGMSAEELSKLFQRFTQADASTTRRFGGTGLGLSLSQAFAEMLGGRVAVESAPGRGSTFTLHLPANYAIPPAAPEPSAHDGDPSWDLVLVIDDDADQRALMTRVLRREKFRVEVAADGRSGLELARRLRPRAILLDVLMPGIDGWSVLTELKSDPALSAIPVVMVTSVDQRNLAASLGAADYMLKPVDWNRLGQLVNRFRSSSGNILLVEDEAATRLDLRTALEKEGWSVTEASDGREALEAAGARRPALVLLDLTMPVMDGFRFLEELRRMPGCTDVPVVILTARQLTREDRNRLSGASQILNMGDVSLKGLAQRLQDIVEAPEV